MGYEGNQQGSTKTQKNLLNTSPDIVQSLVVTVVKRGNRQKKDKANENINVTCELQKHSVEPGPAA